MSWGANDAPWGERFAIHIYICIYNMAFVLYFGLFVYIACPSPQSLAMKYSLTHLFAPPTSISVPKHYKCFSRLPPSFPTPVSPPQDEKLPFTSLPLFLLDATIHYPTNPQIESIYIIDTIVRVGDFLIRRTLPARVEDTLTVCGAELGADSLRALGGEWKGN